MTSEMFLTVALFLLGGIFTVMWYLLQRKDAAQQDEIKGIKEQQEKNKKELEAKLEIDCKRLWEKHDEDATALTELRLQIAAKHYERSELDSKFNELNNTLRSSFEKLGEKIDENNKVMLSHLNEHIRERKHENCNPN